MGWKRGVIGVVLLFAGMSCVFTTADVRAQSAETETNPQLPEGDDSAARLSSDRPDDENSGDENSGDEHSGDRQLRARAEALAEIARSIRINGNIRDWREIPVFNEVRADDCDDRTRDIVAASVAPLSDQILVMLDTRGRPSKAAGAFWISFDLWDHQVRDFQIGFGRDGGHTLWTYKNGEALERVAIEGIEVKTGSVLTARIPIESVRKAFESSTTPFPDDPMSRGWVRIETSSYVAEDETYVDYGPSAASPVLDQSTFFDLPVEMAGDRQQWGRQIPLPVNGKWYIGQGAFGIWTHQDQHAYDLYMVDSTLQPAETRFAKTNPEYLCWDNPVFAPVRGRVMSTRADSIDNQPLEETRRDANSVELNIGGNMLLDLVHLRQDSVTVQPGELVEPGTVIGRVGSSGSYTQPHLHLDVWKMPGRSATVPLAFENVRVSLNSDADCPWTREFPAWVASEGFFVERMKQVEIAGDSETGIAESETETKVEESGSNGG